MVKPRMVEVSAPESFGRGLRETIYFRPRRHGDSLDYEADFWARTPQDTLILHSTTPRSKAEMEEDVVRLRAKGWRIMEDEKP